MKFKPENKLTLIEENEYNERMKDITDLYSELCHSGTFESFDNSTINYEYYLCENAVGSIVIVHGFTEFCKKFYEMAYYYLNMGYNVFLYDQRGHGYSARKHEDTELTHVDTFWDYVKDLEQYIDKIVLPESDGLPIYLFAHSMGGSVAALYLMNCGDKVKKAILSSPMVEPTLPVPRFVLKAYIKSCAKKEGWDARFPHFGKFDPNASFEKSSDSSYNRFKSNLDMRINDLKYRNSTSSYSWMYEAITVRKKLLVRKQAKKISAEILLFNAGRDTVVKNKPQLKFAKMIPNCRIEYFAESKHSVYTGDSETLVRFYNEIFEFLKN